MMGRFAIVAFGLLCWALLLGSLNRRSTAGTAVADGGHVLLGSSNIRQSFDGALLDSLTDARWINLAQRGLAGVELLSWADHFVLTCPAEHLPSALYLEWIPSPPDLSPNWRLASGVSLVDFASWQMQVAEAGGLYPRLRAVALHGVMRATHGLHTLLRSAAPEPFALKGEVARHQRPWRLRTAADSTWLDGLREAEKRLAQNAPPAATAREFNMLRKLTEHCAERDITLVALVQPAAGSTAGDLQALADILGRPAVILDGGDLRPSPFADPRYLHDGRHLNAAGVERITRHFADQINE